MKILISAFLPFDNNEINYSIEVLKRIDKTKFIKKITLPVEYYNSFKILKEEILKFKPNIIIILGEARTYKNVAFEIIGNNQLSNKPDNNNLIPKTKKIIKNGPDVLFSTLDYNLFKKAFISVNADYHLSYSAGTYVCNSLLYQTLYYIKQTKKAIKCGFIHIPMLDNYQETDVINGLNKYLELLKEQ